LRARRPDARAPRRTRRGAAPLAPLRRGARPHRGALGGRGGAGAARLRAAPGRGGRLRPAGLRPRQLQQPAMTTHPRGELSTMSARVREILSWYGSDNPGTLANLARVMNHGRLAGTGRFAILPVDQGFEHGPARSFAPNPPAYDPRYHFELALAAGCNAYAAPLGFLEAGAAEFAGEIPLILKLNNSDSLSGGSDPCPAITGSVDDALRLSCSAPSTDGASSSSRGARRRTPPPSSRRCAPSATAAASGRSSAATPSSGRGARRSNSCAR